MSFRPTSAVLAALALAALTLPFAGCATLGGANYYSVDQEWQAGQQLEAELARKLPLTNDRTVTAYVNRLGQAMARQTQLGNRPWRFYVVRDDAINAFNVPGGLVYINTGLIEQVGSASELAGAIAHEVAHGAARHGTQRLSAAQEANVLAGAIGVGGGVEGIAAQIAAQGAFASFSRRDEREADRLGVQIMANVGYDPGGLGDLLERLAAQERGGGVAFFRTHPLSSDRMQEVRRLAQAYNGRGLARDDREFAAVRRRAGQL
ncbi:M48 family metallopeptidase [Rubrivirga sp. IMCC43871]|uniref:M48 family metallopeptidase n=1 Tax=Rubrivirga sp. IMCC43871 TaxID=3391575 RepID=UPI0039902D07